MSCKLSALAVPGDTRCFRYRAIEKHSVCQGCGEWQSAAPATTATESVSLVFTGNNAEVVRRFQALSHADGHNPVDDVAIVLDLFMDGELFIRDAEVSA